jgi:isoquinoline 1-oxidoreductase beta subunit
MAIVNLSRRGFLGSSALAAGGLLLGFTLPVRTRADAATAEPAELTAFLRIAPDGGITFFDPFVEMGQGTYTSIPQIVAEELDADLTSFTVEQAPPGDAYKVMFGGTRRFTGGSRSVRSSYETMRKVGATARAMLVQAAARQWGSGPAECVTEHGRVVHIFSDRKLTYGELAAAAAQLEPPANPTLKAPDQFSLIGTSAKRTDTPFKVNGKAEFGIDVRLPGMVYAAIRHNPVFGSTLKSYDAAKIKGMPGVVGAYEVPNGVAVVADSFWRAKQAAAALPVTYDQGENADLTSDGLLQTLQARLDEPGAAAEREGDVKAALAGAAHRIEATYAAPFLAHATMEPMNCTAEVKSDGCTVWAPNQGVDPVVGVAARITGLAPEKITAFTPYLGGGFGRRSVLDYVAEVVTLAKAVGRPVKLVWTREEDTQHDHFRPLSTVRLRAGLDEQGQPIALHATTVGDGPLRRLFPSALKNPALDRSVFEGLNDKPYAIPAREVDYVYEPIPVPIGFWRSVGNSMNAFFYESFLDELAHAAGADPVAYRRALLAKTPDYLNVLDKVATMAGWKGAVYKGPDGAPRAMGVALHESFGSIVGEIAEVGVEGGAAKVHKVWCAIDVGTVVNPEIVRAQMESGIVYGLSATLLEEVTLAKGRVEQANFDTYPVLPPDRMPEIEVQVLASGRPIGGVGEPGTPPIAPAVCNAVFTLTGQRIRRLPLARYQLKAA